MTRADICRLCLKTIKQKYSPAQRLTEPSAINQTLITHEVKQCFPEVDLTAPICNLLLMCPKCFSTVRDYLKLKEQIALTEMLISKYFDYEKHRKGRGPCPEIKIDLLEVATMLLSMNKNFFKVNLEKLRRKKKSRVFKRKPASTKEKSTVTSSKLNSETSDSKLEQKKDQSESETSFLQVEEKEPEIDLTQRRTRSKSVNKQSVLNYLKLLPITKDTVKDTSIALEKDCSKDTTLLSSNNEYLAPKSAEIEKILISQEKSKIPSQKLDVTSQNTGSLQKSKISPQKLDISIDKSDKSLITNKKDDELILDEEPIKSSYQKTDIPNVTFDKNAVEDKNDTTLLSSNEESQPLKSVEAEKIFISQEQSKISSQNSDLTLQKPDCSLQKSDSSLDKSDNTLIKDIDYEVLIDKELTKSTSLQKSDVSVDKSDKSLTKIIDFEVLIDNELTKSSLLPKSKVSTQMSDLPQKESGISVKSDKSITKDDEDILLDKEVAQIFRRGTSSKTFPFVISLKRRSKSVSRFRSPSSEDTSCSDEDTDDIRDTLSTKRTMVRNRSLSSIDKSKKRSSTTSFNRKKAMKEFWRRRKSVDQNKAAVEAKDTLVPEGSVNSKDTGAKKELVSILKKSINSKTTIANNSKDLVKENACLSRNDAIGARRQSLKRRKSFSCCEVSHNDVSQVKSIIETASVSNDMLIEGDARLRSKERVSTKDEPAKKELVSILKKSVVATSRKEDISKDTRGSVKEDVFRSRSKSIGAKNAYMKRSKSVSCFEVSSAKNAIMETDSAKNMIIESAAKSEERVSTKDLAAKEGAVPIFKKFKESVVGTPRKEDILSDTRSSVKDDVCRSRSKSKDAKTDYRKRSKSISCFEVTRKAGSAKNAIVETDSEMKDVFIESAVKLISGEKLSTKDLAAKKDVVPILKKSVEATPRKEDISNETRDFVKDYAFRSRSKLIEARKVYGKRRKSMSCFEECDTNASRETAIIEIVSLQKDIVIEGESKLRPEESIITEDAVVKEELASILKKFVGTTSRKENISKDTKDSVAENVFQGQSKSIETRKVNGKRRKSISCCEMPQKEVFKENAIVETVPLKKDAGAAKLRSAESASAKDTTVKKELASILKKAGESTSTTEDNLKDTNEFVTEIVEARRRTRTRRKCVSSTAMLPNDEGSKDKANCEEPTQQIHENVQTVAKKNGGGEAMREYWRQRKLFSLARKVSLAKIGSEHTEVQADSIEGNSIKTDDEVSGKDRVVSENNEISSPKIKRVRKPRIRNKSRNGINRYRKKKRLLAAAELSCKSAASSKDPSMILSNENEDVKEESKMSKDTINENTKTTEIHKSSPVEFDQKIYNLRKKSASSKSDPLIPAKDESEEMNDSQIAPKEEESTSALQKTNNESINSGVVSLDLNQSVTNVESPITYQDSASVDDPSNIGQSSSDINYNCDTDMSSNSTKLDVGATTSNTSRIPNNKRVVKDGVSHVNLRKTGILKLRNSRSMVRRSSRGTKSKLTDSTALTSSNVMESSLLRANMKSDVQETIRSVEKIDSKSSPLKDGPKSIVQESVDVLSQQESPQSSTEKDCTSTNSSHINIFELQQNTSTITTSSTEVSSTVNIQKNQNDIDTKSGDNSISKYNLRKPMRLLSKSKSEGTLLKMDQLSRIPDDFYSTPLNVTASNEVIHLSNAFESPICDVNEEVTYSEAVPASKTSVDLQTSSMKDDTSIQQWQKGTVLTVRADLSSENLPNVIEKISNSLSKELVHPEDRFSDEDIAIAKETIDEIISNLEASINYSESENCDYDFNVSTDELVLKSSEKVLTVVQDCTVQASPSEMYAKEVTDCASIFEDLKSDHLKINPSNELVVDATKLGSPSKILAEIQEHREYLGNVPLMENEISIIEAEVEANLPSKNKISEAFNYPCDGITPLNKWKRSRSSYRKHSPNKSELSIKRKRIETFPNHENQVESFDTVSQTSLEDSNMEEMVFLNPIEFKRDVSKTSKRKLHEDKSKPKQRDWSDFIKPIIGTFSNHLENSPEDIENLSKLLSSPLDVASESTNITINTGDLDNSNIYIQNASYSPNSSLMLLVNPSEILGSPEEATSLQEIPSKVSLNKALKDTPSNNSSGVIPNMQIENVESLKEVSKVGLQPKRPRRSRKTIKDKDTTDSTSTEAALEKSQLQESIHNQCRLLTEIKTKRLKSLKTSPELEPFSLNRKFARISKIDMVGEAKGKSKSLIDEVLKKQVDVSSKIVNFISINRNPPKRILPKSEHSLKQLDTSLEINCSAPNHPDKVLIANQNDSTIKSCTNLQNNHQSSCDSTTSIDQISINDSITSNTNEFDYITTNDSSTALLLLYNDIDTDLTEHTAQVQKEGYHCQSCDRAFKTENSLRTHKRWKHPKGLSKAFGCNVCNETFRYIGELRDHVRQKHHINRRKINPRQFGKVLYCDQCPKSFIYRRNFVEHQKLFHKCKGLKYSCSECLKIFISQEDVLLHQKVHKTGKIITDKRNLRRPELFHCIICTRDFLSKEFLVTHMKQYHYKTFLLCAHCPRKFHKEIGLKRHMRSCHNEEVRENRFEQMLAGENVQTRLNQVEPSLNVSKQMQSSLEQVKMGYNMSDNLQTLTGKVIRLQKVGNNLKQAQAHLDQVQGGSSVSKQMLTSTGMVLNLQHVENNFLHIQTSPNMLEQVSNSYTQLQTGLNMSKHLQATTGNKLLTLQPSQILEQVHVLTPEQVQLQMNQALTIKQMPEQVQTVKQTQIPVKQLQRPVKPVKIRPEQMQKPLKRIRLSKAQLAALEEVHLQLEQKQLEVAESQFKKDYSTLRMSAVHTHIETFSCRICDLNYASKNELTKHVQSHIKLNKIECDVCQNQFSSKDNLEEHVLNEAHYFKRTGSNICKICDSSFNSAEMLKTHMLCNHLNKSYSCGVCGLANLDTITALKQHSADMHNGRCIVIVHTTNENTSTITSSNHTTAIANTTANHITSSYSPSSPMTNDSLSFESPATHQPITGENILIGGGGIDSYSAVLPDLTDCTSSSVNDTFDLVTDDEAAFGGEGSEGSMGGGIVEEVDEERFQIGEQLNYPTYNPIYNSQFPLPPLTPAPTLINGQSAVNCQPQQPMYQPFQHSTNDLLQNLVQDNVSSSLVWQTPQQEVVIDNDSRAQTAVLPSWPNLENVSFDPNTTSCLSDAMWFTEEDFDVITDQLMQE